MKHRKDQQGFEGFKGLKAFFEDCGHVVHYAGGTGQSHFSRHFGGLLIALSMAVLPLNPASAQSSRNLIDRQTHLELIEQANQRLLEASGPGGSVLVVTPDQPIDAMKGNVCPAVSISPELNRWDATRTLTGLERSIRISYAAEDIHRFAVDYSAGTCIADAILAGNADTGWSREQFGAVFAGLNQIATGAPDAMIRELAGFYKEAEATKPYPERLKSPGLDIVARDMHGLKRDLAGAGVDRIIATALDILPRQTASIEARFEKQFERLQQTFDSLAGLYAEMDADDLDAIRRASNDTGADFAELMTKIAIESAFDEEAEADRSSATGLGQHIDQTWLAAVYLYGNQYGMQDYAKDITRRKNRNGAYVYSVEDDTREQEILSLRNDRYFSAAMTGALMMENHTLLSHRLGRSANATDRYIAHMMGPNDAVTLIRAAAQGDMRPARDLYGATNNPAEYNPRFFKRKGVYLAAPTVYQNIDRFISGRLGQFRLFEHSPVSDRELFSRSNAPAPNKG